MSTEHGRGKWFRIGTPFVGGEYMPLAACAAGGQTGSDIPMPLSVHCERTLSRRRDWRGPISRHQPDRAQHYRYSTGDDMSDEPQTAVDVVALALSQIFGRESVSEGMRFRARQIVGALEKSGHLPQHATP